MGVVTVTLPISDTKKVLVVLLHVPVQRIEIVRRKCTEGAQQSLLCVYTCTVVSCTHVEDVEDYLKYMYCS